MVANIAKKGFFYLFIVAIVVYSVFPFYYAIITSFKTGTELFEIILPARRQFNLANYKSVLTSGGSGMTLADIFTLNITGFPRNLVNSIIVSALVVCLALLMAVTAAFALSRVRFRGRGLLLMTILCGVDVPAGRRARRPVRADPRLRPLSTRSGR